MHHRPRDEPIDGDHGVLLARLRRPLARFPHHDAGQLRRGFEVADEEQILQKADDRRHQAVPPLLVFFDAQQVEEQREIERAQRARGDRAQPRGHTLGRIVGELLDLEGLRACTRQLAAVLLRHV